MEISLSTYRSTFYIESTGSTIIKLKDGLNIKLYKYVKYYGIYKLYLNRKVIGYLELHDDNSIWSVKIDENLRGQGYGFIFLNEILSFIKKKTEIDTIRLSVLKTNDVAIKLYEKLGFKILGDNKCSRGTIVMEIKL
jgi:ribosomal protein S18 acetylase RimI-like enzyme